MRRRAPSALSLVGAAAIAATLGGWLAAEEPAANGLPIQPATSHASTRQAAARTTYVTSAAASLITEGLAAPAPTGAEAAAFQEVPAPGVRFLPNVARATNVPWIDSNGWRFARGIRKAHYANLPAGAAALAAAEAFVYGVDAILNPDPADINDLRQMLIFLEAQERPPLPAKVNIGVVDDGSAVMGEVLNLLTRRNLLYTIVRAPDRALDLNIQLGTPDFPRDAAANPYEFAARVRAKLGDDKRVVRLYGTSTVLARFTADRTRARLFLLSLDGRRQQQTVGPQAIRVRLRGRYNPTSFGGFGAGAAAALGDLRHPGDTTEFWVPSFTTCAVVDLDAIN